MLSKTKIREGYVIFLMVLFALLHFKCSSPGSGTIDGLELGKVLSLDLNELALYKSSEPEILEKVNTYFITRMRGLDSLKIYSASSEINKKVFSLKIIVIPLSVDQFAGAFIAISINDGKVDKVRIWGNEFTNQDEDSFIENFYRQFDGKREVPTVTEIMSEIDAGSYVEAMDEQSSYLFKHSLTMFTNSYLIRRTMALTSIDRIPEISWYENIKVNIEQLDENAWNLKELVDDEILLEYKEAAKESSFELSAIITEIQNGAKPSKVRSRIKNYLKTACRGCHNIQTQSEFTIRSKLRAQFFEHGYRTDLYKVGIDVWPMPGKNEESQQLANLVKAGLIYLAISD